MPLLLSLSQTYDVEVKTWDNEQVNSFLMANTNEQVEVKTCFESKTSFITSSNNE